MTRGKLFTWLAALVLAAFAALLGACAQSASADRRWNEGLTAGINLRAGAEEIVVIPRDPTAPASPTAVQMEHGGRGGGGGGAGGLGAGAAAPSAAQPSMPIPGSPVLVTEKAGQFVPVPLAHTDVAAKIAGYIASVGVTQQYQNSSSEKIEAIYVFPLPENAGVSDFVMTIGDRKIRGIIRERDEADRIYQEARRQGYVASMMSQERPNIFTQKVANIEPGKTIDISIQYIHTLSYQDGWFEWVFPMVLGPRDKLADKRPGHDISLAVELEPGVSLEDLVSVNHKIRRLDGANNSTIVQLDPADSLPNKDFVLRYKVAGDKIKTSLFVQKNKAGDGGWFTLLLVPPDNLKSPRPSALANIQVSFDQMKVSEVYPAAIPELVAGRPLIISGRFEGQPSGTATIAGQAGDQKLAWNLNVSDNVEENPAIGAVWARSKLAGLYSQAIFTGRDVSTQVRQTALQYGLVSEYTHFIAVDTTAKTASDTGTSITVPAQQGARYEKVVGP